MLLTASFYGISSGDKYNIVHVDIAVSIYGVATTESEMLWVKKE